MSQRRNGTDEDAQGIWEARRLYAELLVYAFAQDKKKVPYPTVILTV